MQYAVSDIHGCYDKYIELLRRINLKDSDTLYVLGDMIDRGPDVLDILEDFTVYEETEAGGREFVLVHAGLGGFSLDKALDDYQLDELILSRPEPGETYFPHKYLVYGHTPTPYYTGARPEDARIYRRDKLIGIDCGCASGGPLGCLCLDTIEEIYV